MHFFINHISYLVSWTSCSFSNDLLPRYKCVLCLLDLLCVASSLLAVLLVQVRKYLLWYMCSTYELCFKLLDCLFNSRADGWEDVPCLLKCLFLL